MAENVFNTGVGDSGLDENPKKSSIERIELEPDEELVTRSDGTQVIVKKRKASPLLSAFRGAGRFVDNAAEDGSILWLGQKAVEWVGIGIDAIRGTAETLSMKDNTR